MRDKMSAAVVRFVGNLGHESKPELHGRPHSAVLHIFRTERPLWKGHSDHNDAQDMRGKATENR